MSNQFKFTADELARMEKRFAEIVECENDEDDSHETLSDAVGMGACLVDHYRTRLATAHAECEEMRRERDIAIAATAGPDATGGER